MKVRTCDTCGEVEVECDDDYPDDDRVVCERCIERAMWRMFRHGR